MTTTNGTTTTTTSPPKTPKKTNLLDHNSIKHLLDETVAEIVTSRGYKEDVRMSNVRLLIGAIIIVIALFAQFYNKKFPDNKNFLIGCIVLYVLFNGILQLIVYTKEKNAFLFTYPPSVTFGLYMGYKFGRKGGRKFIPLNRFEEGNPCFLGLLEYIHGSAYNSTGLMVSSKLPRFSDMYTLTIASADPKSISAKPTVEFTKSVTKWFAKDGVLVEGLFWKDVESLISDYANAKDNKKSK